MFSVMPPLGLRQRDGRTVSAWDFKQRRNLLIAFLDADCSLCGKFIHDLCVHTPRLREEDAVALLIFPKQPENLPSDPLPEGMFAGVAASADEIPPFLGKDAPAGQALSRRGIFVTDRYGEIARSWIVREHEFPGIKQILTTLNAVEIACEECTVPVWPVDE